MLNLVVTTRLGVKFTNRPLLETRELDSRIDLLRHTSARSLEALAAVAPTWIIQTHPEHVVYIEAAIRSGRLPTPSGCNVQVIGRDGSGFAHDSLQKLDVPERFLCLRLDSDDYYFAEPVVKALRRFADEPPGVLVDFPRGFLTELSGCRSKRFGYPVQGPFYGVVTTRDDPLAAIGNHGHARVGRRCVEVIERSWIQTVHGFNDSTAYRRTPLFEEAKGMLGQARRARGQRPIHQLLLRPVDLIPVSRRQRASLADAVS